MRESIRYAMGGVFPGEDKVFFDELDANAFRGELLHKRPQVIEFLGQAVRAVHDQGVALPDEHEEFVELRALGVLARC